MSIITQNLSWQPNVPLPLHYAIHSSHHVSFYDTKTNVLLQSISNVHEHPSHHQYRNDVFQRNVVLNTRGGGGGVAGLSHHTTSSSPSSSSSTVISKPQAKAVLNMAIAMSLHYLAYSLARPTTLALFTSAETGFAGNHGAFPLAMACISPTSLALLLIYGKILHSSGPRVALRQTTHLCSLGVGLSSIVIYALKQQLKVLSTTSTDTTVQTFTWVLKAIVGILFIFRESYVQLLTSQYWSFMASVTTPQQSSRWFAPITGLTSITSAIAGLGVSVLVDRLGLTGTLCVASTVLMTSTFFTERAYSISDEYGFNPANENHHQISSSSSKKLPPPPNRTNVKNSSEAKNHKEGTSNEKDVGTIQKAADLFARVPVLKGLFLEILAGQGLSTLLNVCFVTKLSQTLPEDGKRAGWMGKFFATINVVSCFLQFAVMPQLLPRMEPRNLWRFMPLVMVMAVSFQSLHKDPSLYVIGGAFMLMKIMEFAIRRLLDEMVYVPLDFESRFVGKEIISVFGYRFGKSGMSLGLSMLTSMFGNFGIQQLSYLTLGSAFIWLSAAWNVSNLVSTRAQAEETYKRNKHV